MTGRALLTIHEVADLTGFCEATLYRWARTGAIPSKKYGTRTIRFERRAIEAWMEASTNKPRKRAS